MFDAPRIGGKAFLERRPTCQDKPNDGLRALCEAVGIRPEPTWVAGKHVEELLEYHVVEHFCGHYGQILMLRHQYRDRKRAR